MAKNLPVVILAGGFGSRLAEVTSEIPKPLVRIGSKPILNHIIDIFYQQGLRHFFILGGFKYESIESYFIDAATSKQCCEIHISSEAATIRDARIYDKYDFYKSYDGIHISIVNTGVNTQTGGRIQRALELLPPTFLLTYGDGLANVCIAKLLATHESNKNQITITIVNPSSRYGRVKLNGNKIEQFSEKPMFEDNWINGGFMVAEKSCFYNCQLSDNSVLESDILARLASVGGLGFYKHTSFWRCMDTMRDRLDLEQILAKNSSNPPWLNFNV